MISHHTSWNIWSWVRDGGHDFTFFWSWIWNFRITNSHPWLWFSVNSRWVHGSINWLFWRMKRDWSGILRVLFTMTKHLTAAGRFFYWVRGTIYIYMWVVLGVRKVQSDDAQVCRGDFRQALWACKGGTPSSWSAWRTLGGACVAFRCQRVLCTRASAYHSDFSYNHHTRVVEDDAGLQEREKERERERETESKRERERERVGGVGKGGEIT